jgi:hypothetical protein
VGGLFREAISELIIRRMSENQGKGTTIARGFSLDVDGKPTVAFEARNQMEANELCRELWLRVDLSSQMSFSVSLCKANSKLSAKPATAGEARLFGEAAKAAANPSDDLVLAYLVDLDS